MASKLTQIKEENEYERALLISVDTGDFDAEISANELTELAKTAGAEVVGVMIQKREAPSAASYVGSGRLAEIRDFCAANEIELVIADGELTPVQARNIENAADARVVDRTMLILDIFAQRARSAEGKIQVELAQLKYSLPRLTGKGTSLSRLGGGIGTRGPGETKLEKRRLAMHDRRQKNGAQAVAIVGYTNVGKSTLMNCLTKAGVLEENKLFATLDPTARKLTLPNGEDIMLVDTVGLVRRLPHKLVDAFHSTLEEALWADVVLNVCDASSPECNEQIMVTNDLLASLGCGDKPVINVMNKCDLVPRVAEFPIIGKCVCISAKNGSGTDKLLEEISAALPQKRRRVSLLLPFSAGKIAGELEKNGVVFSREYTESGIKMDVLAEISYLDKIKDYILPE